MHQEHDPIFNSALAQLNTYIDEAAQFGNNHSDCCFLSTTGKDMKPSVRVITIQKINEKGLLFLSNKNSGKTKQFRENPFVGLCFYWPEINVQATLEGRIDLIDDSLAAELWKKRDYHAQVAAWAIEALEKTTDSELIEQQKRSTKERFQSSRPPLADSWGGYIIEPDRIEFWNTDWKKNKKRERLSKINNRWQRIESY